MDNRRSRRSQRLGQRLWWFTGVVSVVEAYWGVILASSCMLFFMALILSGKPPTKPELGPLALVLAPILAWLGLAGMAIIAALAVPRFVAPLGVSSEGKEAEWVIGMLISTILATFVYLLLFSNFWGATVLVLWYSAAFLFFNEEAAEGIIELLS